LIVAAANAFHPSWEVRHGAACFLRNVLASTSRHWDSELRHQFAFILATVLLRDRFCDFVDDLVVLPVRETVAQALASLAAATPVPPVRSPARAPASPEILNGQELSALSISSPPSSATPLTLPLLALILELLPAPGWEAPFCGFLMLQYLCAAQPHSTWLPGAQLLLLLEHCCMDGLACSTADVRAAAARALASLLAGAAPLLPLTALICLFLRCGRCSISRIPELCAQYRPLLAA
jgi:hypothetical protein